MPSNKELILSTLNAPVSGDVDVMSKSEGRRINQTSKKAKIPEVFFVNPGGISPGFSGAEVNSDTLMSFLSAAEFIADEKNANVKITYKGTDRIYVEVCSNGVWGLIAIRLTKTSRAKFTGVIPLRRAVGVTKRAALKHKHVSVGVLHGMMSIGPVMFALGSMGYPLAPELRDWEARATVPASYFNEISTRVLPAQSSNPTKMNLSGVFLCFDVVEVDDSTQVLCTAISTDGHRIHMLKLPEILVDTTKRNRLPPSTVIPGKFFRYLSAVANKRWTGLEFSEGQILARGEDYIVVSKATMSGNSRQSIRNWRNVDTDYSGYWAADKFELEQVVQCAIESSDSDLIHLNIDATHGSLEIYTQGTTGRYSDKISIKRFGACPFVSTSVSGRCLADAISACAGGLVRLGFSDVIEKHSSSAVVVRGVDELFKAVIMPIVPIEGD